MGQYIRTEFVIGVYWCLFGDGCCCPSRGWDEKAFVWNIKTPNVIRSLSIVFLLVSALVFGPPDLSTKPGLP